MTGDRRGTSEVVGFVLVFAVVFAGIGVVQTAGFEAVTDVRDGQRAASAERAFLTLARNVDDLRHGAPGRAGSLRLGPGRLQVAAGPEVTLVDDGTDRTFGTGTLTYAVDATRLSYASGGVFRGDDGGAVVLDEPALACGRGPANATIVAVVAFRPSETGVDTDGPASVVLRANDTVTRRVDAVSLDVSGVPHADAWGRYLDGTGWSETAPSVYTCDAAGATVRRTTVDLRFVA